jgi:hypothetical protein
MCLICEANRDSLRIRSSAVELLIERIRTFPMISGGTVFLSDPKEIVQLDEIEISCEELKFLPKINNVRKIVVTNCKNLKRIEVDQFTKIFSIKNCSSLKEISFTNLSFLKIVDCPKLKSPGFLKENSSGVFEEKNESLQTLILINCQSLKTIPVFKNLTSLFCCKIGVKVIKNYPNLTNMTFVNLHRLEKVETVHQLQNKILLFCPNLVTNLPVASFNNPPPIGCLMIPESQVSNNISSN